MLLALVLVVLPAGRALADPNWTGAWDTRWRDGGARLLLNESGGHVTGTYPAYGGRIDGTASGRVLDGSWFEGKRTGRLRFVMSLDERTFMGRFDTGQWWTGGRAADAPKADTVAIDQSGVREALRTFVLAGDAARDGNIDELATAAAVVDFGPAAATLAPGEKLAAAHALFDLVDQTTFELWNMPGKRALGPMLHLDLHQAGTDATLPVDMVQAPDRRWFVRMPDAAAMANARRALLARSGGRLPGPDDYLRLGSPRDTMRAFMAAIDDPSEKGREQLVATLDLSGFSAATRDSEGSLAAQYLDEVLDRVGMTVPQEIPDDPASHDPFLVFSHPSGQVVLAPTPDTHPTTWQFSSGTVGSARDLYIAVEDMPKADSDEIPTAPSLPMQLRNRVRDRAPALLDRVAGLEAWQLVGGVLILVLSAVTAAVLAAALSLVLRRAVGGKEFSSERQFRWPLRLALTFLLFRLGMLAIGLPEAANRVVLGITGIGLAVAVVWGGWKLLDTAGNHLGSRGAGSLDDILVSLVLTLCKLALLAGGLVFIATALSIPYGGVVAGLGIGGLAVAFASRETLSNVFGAAILVADRPFRRGDWIVAGDTQGTVEQVGIRSTRIRTADDSLVVVPNGKLSDATVTNLGTRRHRIVRASLMVAHGTRPAQLEDFLRGLAELAPKVPGVLSERTDIGVASVGPDGIRVDLACVLDVRTWAQERDGRSALMLDILRLAERLGIRLTPVAAAAA